jgi:membrane-bound lytic murein transglycosylase D
MLAILLNTSLSMAKVSKWSSSLPQKSLFKIDPSLQARVDFWIDIYSKYTTSEGVFHHVHHPDIVYAEIDLTTIQNNSVLTEEEKKRQSKKMIDQQRRKIITQFKIKNASDLRLQMGLKDRTQKALYLSGQYLPMMEKIFKDRNLPPELTRLVFVESSFNIFAQSKVGASGLWQIMPFVGRAEGYLQKYYDKRNHPYYSTLLAADMLKQNFNSLKSWPLAITAYNHGLTGVRRMKSAAGSDQIQGLIASQQRTKSWGFASENFYACFLAILEVEKNANMLFGNDLLQLRPLKTKNIYLKTATHKNKILNLFDGNLQKLKTYNPHLRFAQIRQKKYFPAGVPLIIPANKEL